MGEVVNLRIARKAKQRVEDAAIAAQNRAKFGATKAESNATGADAARQQRLLDGAQRSDD